MKWWIFGKKKRPNHTFSEDDREFSKEIREINAQSRKLKLEAEKVKLAVEKEKLKRVRAGLQGDSDKSESPVSSILRHEKEMSQLREILGSNDDGYEDDEPREDSVAEKFVMDMVLEQLKKGKGGINDEKELTEKLKQSEDGVSERLRGGVSSGGNKDAILNSIPPHVATAVKSGLISKEQFRKEAVKYAEKKADEVYGKLKKGHSKVPKTLNSRRKRTN